jgi:glycosyltransferase involved in cell wall biosynthesis
MKILVTIIVPCYNQAQYLPEALQSVLEQTYSNWECIIVNDGSPDNTEEVTKVWVQKDNRFKYTHKENGGLSSARNAGLDLATGDYIQFLDADDLIHYTKFEKAISIISKNAEGIVVSNFTKFKLKPENTVPTFWELKLESINYHNILNNWDNSFAIPIHCGFFPVSYFFDFRFPIVLQAKEDWIMWIYIFRNNPRCFFINEKLAYYRVQPKSMTSNPNLLNMNYIKALKCIKSIVLPHDYEQLLLSNLERKSRLSIEYQERFKEVKESNSFKVGYRIKRILSSLGCLFVFKKIINKYYHYTK